MSITSSSSSPDLGRQPPNTSPISSGENSIRSGLNDYYERDSRNNNITESNILLNILEEVTELADRTNNLKLKVMDAIRHFNHENCNFSEHGLYMDSRYGSGVYNNRSNPDNPVREEPMSRILRLEIESRRAEAQEFTENFMNRFGV